MIKNYFKIAWRNFIKDRTYAIINLIGLAIALAGVLIISAYVKFELSFDKYYSNSNRIYRVAAERKKDNVYEKTLTLPDPLAYTLKNEFPEIESVSKMISTENDLKVNDKVFTTKYITVDSNFFQMFNITFLYGNSTIALQNENNIVLTESLAEKLFTRQNPMGKQVSYRDYSNNFHSYRVSAVIRNIPANSHFSAEAIVSKFEKAETLSWKAYSTSGVKYIMLKKGADVQSLNKKILSIYKKYDFPKDVRIILQPVTSIHLYSHIRDEPFTNSDIKYIYIFSFVALLILVIACVNYINLTTARSSQRLKEVGMRKVMGAGKKQLALQFTAESVLFFLVTIPLAFIIAYIMWPFFAGIANVSAGQTILLNWQFIAVIIILSLATGFISGAYPAFFLSRLKPISTLKDGQKSFGINLGIRKTLIVFQFFISIALIIITIIIYKQFQFLNNVQLGFNKDYLITLPSKKFTGSASSFKNELLSGKDILDVSVSSWRLSNRYSGSSSMSQPADSTKEWNFGFVYADNDFLKTMQIKLIDGKNFLYNDDSKIDSLLQQDKQYSQEEFMDIVSSRPMIITKTTAQNLGLKKPLVGQVVNLASFQGTIVGVINDFKGISLLENNPMIAIYQTSNPSFGNTYIRINSKNIPQTIDFIRSKWKEFFPYSNFEFLFMDDQVAALYKDQHRMAILFTAFATLAILISLMGLFSLVALVVQQKTKEIGIRKVLGASVIEIVQLISGGFIKLVSIAFIIAAPLVWWAMNIWLQNFQYRTSISWWIFFITGLSCLLFALVVITIQAIKAAMANPVESLRTE